MLLKKLLTEKKTRCFLPKIGMIVKLFQIHWFREATKDHKLKSTVNSSKYFNVTKTPPPRFFFTDAGYAMKLRN